jgi:hypothetical protein
VTGQVVIRFRFAEPLVREVIFRRELDAHLDDWFAGVIGLDVDAQETDESGEDEGRAMGGKL